jgi:sugar phosphate isomerase/epimerase
MSGAKLSAFADEVSEELREQAKYLSDEGVRYIELRLVNKKNIVELNKAELHEAKKLIEDFGLKVSAIGSPIGKVGLDEPFGPHLDKFRHAVELALFFQTPFLRIFSYYAPRGENIDGYRDEVIERMRAKVDIVKDIDVILVHENERGIYGHSAENCVELIETVGSPKLRLAYDPANFVTGDGITDNITSCWPLMKPYVVHVHIKDWKVGADVGSIPGEGDGQIKELLGELAVSGYEGFVTMEPHLQAGGQFGGFTGHELFSKAIAAVRKISQQAGLKLE